jgi:hypothetical protein
MIVVKIFLWPFGNEEREQQLGEVRIHNDCTGTKTTGNYGVKLMKSMKYAKLPGIWKSGHVTGFPRLILGPYDLLYRALVACGIDTRNIAKGAEPKPRPSGRSLSQGGDEQTVETSRPKTRRSKRS